uniref:Ig-like domain-containing protein n=1 Tax=Octopus bimaculoides TaxID=37653 RepID=A0A0L8GVD7_OCTBM
MEFSLLHLRYVLIVRCFCVSLKPIDGGIKFVRQNQPETLECPLAKQKVENWQIGLKEISSLHWLPVKTNEIEANVIPGKDNILNITLLSSNDVTLLCKSTDKWIKFQAVPMYNDNGNLYPISGTPYVIKDKKFTLKCNEDGSGTSTTWYTGNGTVIAKYSGASNQNYSKYFGSRQETSCQNKSCTLSITNVSLDEDDMSIICRSSFHISMFNIKVIVLPKSVTIKNISNTVPVENQNKSYECLIKDTNPTFSVFWLITMKDGTPKNATKYISNRPSKSGKLTTLSSKLTLTLNKNFQKLQCVAYFPGKNEFVNYSKELDLHIKYPPERDNMILNVFGGKVCIDTPAKFQCSWEGGNPPASVTLMYKDISYTTKENVELNVEPSESHQTVKCLGTHIVANVSCEKNLTFYYPPQINMHILEEKNATVINCTLFDMNPATNKYILKQKWGNTTKNTYDTNVFIKNPSFNNAGTWECHISNENFCMSKPLNYKIPVRPILSSIASDPKKRSVSNGESVILKQCFYSHPKSDVKWQKNEELIDSNKYLTSGFVSSEFPFKRSCTSLKIMILVLIP